MFKTSSVPAENRYAMFLTMVHLGAIATLLLIATLIFDLPGFVDGLPQGMLFVAIGAILYRKLRDDYVEDLWKAGISAAFVAIAVCFLFAPLALGLLGDMGGNAPWRDAEIAVQWPAAIAFLAFFAGFYRRMLSGGASR